MPLESNHKQPRPGRGGRNAMSDEDIYCYLEHKLENFLKAEPPPEGWRQVEPDDDEFVSYARNAC